MFEVGDEVVVIGKTVSGHFLKIGTIALVVGIRRGFYDLIGVSVFGNTLQQGLNISDIRPTTPLDKAMR